MGVQATRADGFKYLIISLILLIVADGLLTQFLITHDLGSEVNPFLSTIVGESKFLLIKIGGALLASLLLLDMHRLRPKVALISSTAAVVFYTAIVYWNISVFFIAQM